MQNQNNTETYFKWKILKLICELGEVFKEDIFLYTNNINETIRGSDVGSKKWNAKYTSRIFKSLKDSGYIEEVQPAYLKKSKKATDKTIKSIRPTQKGYARLFDHYRKLDETIAKQKSKEQGKKVEAVFRPIIKAEPFTVADKSLSQLSKNRIKIYFSIAGAKSFTFEKPSLSFLYSELSFSEYIPPQQKNYLDSELLKFEKDVKRSKIKSILSNGIYYSIEELEEFLILSSANISGILDDISPKDSITGRKAKGFFLRHKDNKTDCDIVFYTNERKRVVDTLRCSLNLQTILSDLLFKMGLDELKRDIWIRGINSSTNYFSHSFNAIVISRSNLLFKDMVYGDKLSELRCRKAGRYRQEAKTIEQLEAEIMEHKRNKMSSEYLDFTSLHYPYIFFIDCSANGLIDLKYLVNTNIEEWANEQKEVMTNSFGLISVREKLEFLQGYISEGDEQRLAIYMPLREVKMMKALLNLLCRGEKLAIIVTPFTAKSLEVMMTGLGADVQFYYLVEFDGQEAIKDFVSIKKNDGYYLKKL